MNVIIMALSWDYHGIFLDHPTNPGWGEKITYWWGYLISPTGFFKNMFSS
jgi:hypothetical protein